MDGRLDDGPTSALERALRERLLARPPLCPNLPDGLLLQSSKAGDAFATKISGTADLQLGLLAAVRSDALLRRRGEELMRMVASLAAAPFAGH